MTIDQLRYFQAVCKYNNVSYAAEILHISQPSVSNAVANLEKEFGVTLFTRYHKRLILTEEGQILCELSAKLLSQAEHISQTMNGLRNKSNALRLGIPPMIGSLILPILYGEYLKLHPRLQVQIAEDDTTGLQKLFAEDQIDLAFLPHTNSFGDDLYAQPLAEVQNVCCVSKSHPFAAQKSVKFTELADEQLVLFNNGFFHTERILDEFARHGLTPNVLMHSSQLSTVQNMIANGTAIGFMFEFLLKSTNNIVGIAMEPPMKTQICIVFKNNKPITETVNDLIQFIKSRLEQ